jgi:hypothetical protein
MLALHVAAGPSRRNGAAIRVASNGCLARRSAISPIQIPEQRVEANFPGASRLEAAPTDLRKAPATWPSPHLLHIAWRAAALTGEFVLQFSDIGNDCSSLTNSPEIDPWSLATIRDFPVLSSTRAGCVGRMAWVACSSGSVQPGEIAPAGGRWASPIVAQKA